MAAAVGASDFDRGATLDGVVRYLTRRQLLLILDNCEHVLDQAAIVAATVLEQCPDVHLLATSREAPRSMGKRYGARPVARPGSGQPLDHRCRRVVGRPALRRSCDDGRPLHLRWCGDITEIPTGDGKLYLATVIDLYSRRLLAAATSLRCDAELCEQAIKIAATVRGGKSKIDKVVFHTDRGSTYTAQIVHPGLL